MLSALRSFMAKHGLVFVLAVLAYVLPATADAEVGSLSTDAVWMEVDERVAGVGAVSPPILDPYLYRVFELDSDALTRTLAAAPLRRTDAARTVEVEITLPMPDGSYAKFLIQEAPVFSPELQAAYPGIRSFMGQGIDDPTATTRFVQSQIGFRAFVRTTEGMILVEPYERGDARYVISYSVGRVQDRPGFQCLIDEYNDHGFFEGPDNGRAAPSGATLSTYRLAISTTGEYTQFHDPGGGTTTTAAEVAATVAALNAIYTPDNCVELNVVALNAYLDPTTDPFANPDNANGLLAQNQADLDLVVGDANYDIGHIFHARSTGGFSGVATVGVVCQTGSKGRGVSTHINPTAIAPGASATWLIDLVPHEFGHQFSARHSWNALDPATNCTAGQRDPPSAFELGSGSTIMAYNSSGCIPDLPGGNDPYFHTHSFDAITTYRDGGGNCATTAATGNTPPEVDAGPDYTIPQGTPFTLKAVGTDADGHALTYCWEQHDNDGPSPETPTNTVGPLFRSHPPTINPSRTIPEMEDVLAGPPAVPGWLPFEMLPAVDRSLDFRCTVRDNRVDGGGVNYDHMLITVSGDPFLVDYPNGGETLIAGCPIVVEWTVGGGIVAAYVNILYSSDGGDTWTFLMTDTPNDGAELVEMPCEPTTEGRILIEASDNIFFDVSDDDFEIVFPEITVTADVDESYDPLNPWLQDGIIIDHFEVTSDANLFNLHFVPDPLQDHDVPCEPGMVKMLSGDLIEFVPEVINYLEAGETVEVEIKIVIPVGQHAGDYEGLVHVLAEPECGCPMTISEDFEVAVEVEDETDVDFADDRGNVTRDLTVHLVGAKLDDVSGMITVVNPDSDENNADMSDGPGNIRIELTDTEISDLVKVGDLAVAIPGSAITLTGSYDFLRSGEAEEIEVMVSIPDGIPVNATYMGTVTFYYESCLGGQEVSDTFTIMLEVLQTQGDLDIVASEINLDFCYVPPWLAPGEVEFSFDITAIGDHRNIRISTGGLEHPTLPTKLEDFAFFPEEIAFLAAGETRTVDVIATIPIGQHEGLYSGYIHIVSENHGEDQVPVSLDVCGEHDIDIRDNYANLSGNVMEISCTARSNQSGGEWALRAFDIGLPDEVANNYDDFDGPGNAPIDCVSYEFAEWSYLWQDDDQGHNYHLDKVFTGEGSVVGELCDWSSGEFRRLYVAIFVPKMTGGDNHPGTYKGRLDCWASVEDTDVEVSHDFFDIEVHLSRRTGHEDGEGDSDFGGFPDEGGARLYWGRFDQLGLMGEINIYRGDHEAGMYTRLNNGPLAPSSSYLDTAIEAGEEYDYRLGIGSGDDEFFIGPVTVGGAPKVFYLGQNAPNPFRDGTSISYDLPSRGQVSLKIYDVSGRLVRVLRDREEPAGFYTAKWDRMDERGREVAAGVYFYSFSTPLFEETRKMVVLR